MATTLPPEIEAEFEHRWCRVGEHATVVDAWLVTLGITFDSEAYATRNALYRPWSNHPADEQFHIRASDYHIPGEDGEQAFHVNMEIRLDRDSVIRRHAYLAFLLAHGDLDRTLPDE